MREMKPSLQLPQPLKNFPAAAVGLSEALSPTELLLPSRKGSASLAWTGSGPVVLAESASVASRGLSGSTGQTSDTQAGYLAQEATYPALGGSAL